jgi:putative PIN family toxin of toxin-antitoxin system
VKVIRAVLDTNILVSGLCFGGLPARILRLSLTGRIDWLISPYLVDEFKAVMKLKFPDREAAVLETLNEFAELWRMAPAASRPRLRVISADPDDDHVLECALAGDAECIVSSDMHLLNLKQHRNIVILTPAQFLRRYGF